MVAVMVRLLELDDLWTHAALARPLAPADQGPSMASLQSLAEEMIDLLKRMGEHSALLAELGEALGDDGDDRLNFFLWTDDLQPEDRQDLRWLTTRLGGFQGMARSASEALSNYQDEINSIEQRISQLQAGSRASGDLSRKFRCGLGQGIIISGVASLPATAAAAAGAGIAVGALGAAALVAATGGVDGVAVIVEGLLVIRRSRC